MRRKYSYSFIARHIRAGRNTQDSRPIRVKQRTIAMNKRSTLLTFALISLAGCTSTKRTFVAPETYSAPASAYAIGNGDRLDIRVWRNPDLSVVTPVRPDGMISVPLAGEVQATGKTVEELKAEISSKLNDYLKQPNVTVIVTEANSIAFTQRVRITGAVGNPSSTPWRQGMTVLDLVLLAGGSTEFADENKARLYRKTQDGIQTYPIYLEDIFKQGKLETNYELAPSDIVSVPERFF